MFARTRDAYQLGGSILFLGVQDVVGSRADVEKILLDGGFSFDASVPTSSAPAESRRHKEFAHISGIKDPAPMDEVLRMLGFSSVDSMDAFENEDPTILHDLNRPVPNELHERFDVVADNGGLEHVCDIRAAIENVVRMVKVGGAVVLYNPMVGEHNQCLFNLQPAFFFDVFSANGFDDLKMYLHFFPRYGQFDFGKSSWQEYRYGDETTFQKRFANTNSFFVAKKTRPTGEFVVPMQRYYVDYHTNDGETPVPSPVQSDEPDDDRPWVLDQIPSVVRPLYPLLAPAYRMMPNWVRCCVLDGVLKPLRYRRELADRERFRL